MTNSNKKIDTSVKITVVGDGAVGKTCMLVVYTSKKFPKIHIPTVFDNYAEDLQLDGVNYKVKLWDTAGQEDYERLLPLCYTDTTCFLVCFSISAKDSYDNVQSKWLPSVRQHMPNTPIILVGTKSDLRMDGDPNQEMVSERDGQKMKRTIKAVDYLECSALRNEGLQEIIHAAVRASRTAQVPIKLRFCTML